MAIGRFMSIDPLTEEYHTWSPYAFSGNRVVDARELEGLEPIKSTSTDGKTVNITLRVKPTNSTVNNPLTQEQFNNDLKNGKSQSERDYSGDAGNGVTLNVSIIYDESATNTLDMVDVIKNPESTSPLEQYIDSQAPGFTSTDLASTQVSSLNTKHDSSDKSFKDGAGSVISHEFGHQLGLSDTSQEQRDEDSRNEKGNKMDSPSRTPPSKVITPEQRALIIEFVKEEK